MASAKEMDSQVYSLGIGYLESGDTTKGTSICLAGRANHFAYLYTERGQLQELKMIRITHPNCQSAALLHPTITRQSRRFRSAGNPFQKKNQHFLTNVRDLTRTIRYGPIYLRPV